MDKNSFLIYLDYKEHFELLNDEQLGKLLRAIMEYEETGIVPDLEGMEKMAFSFIRAQLDRDREKYENKCEKNKLNGAKGGRPKKAEGNNNNPENPTVFSESEQNQNQPKKPDNDNDNDNDTDNDNKKGINKRKSFKDVFVEKKVTQNIKQALMDFIDMRKAIKKPLTTKALELKITKLNKLSTDEETQIAIINQSIESSWQDFYPLKNEKGEANGTDKTNNSKYSGINLSTNLAKPTTATAEELDRAVEEAGLM